MKGLLTKDFLTIKKKYGLPRVIMDIAIIIALMFILEKSGTIYISFLLIPIEIMSMIISLTTCDEQWKWGKYAVSLPVSKKQIVCSRYACAGILSLIGFVVALIVNSASYILFPQYAYHFADAMAEVDRVAEDEGLKQSLRRYAIESGAIMERVYRKEMELPIENMKQFLDGILHIYDEGRTAVKMGDLFGIVTAAEERVAEKEKFRGTLTSENAD